jgi:hypothetical protein
MSLIDRWEENSQEQVVVETTDNVPQQVIPVWKQVLWWIFLVGLFIALLFSYFGHKLASVNTLYIDNPTSEEIKVQIDDWEILSIDGKFHKVIDLKAWVHSLKVDWEDKWEFTKGKFDWKAFLNPTKSVYVKEVAIYTNDENFDDRSYIDIEIDWEIYNGPFTKYNDYYITWDWTYGLDESLPDEASSGKYSKETTKIKIYRLDEFKKMYDKWYK